MKKTLQQELKKLEAKETEAQLWACVKHMHRQKTKNFLLVTSKSTRKLLNSISKKLKTAGKLFFKDKLGLKRVRTVKNPDLPYNNDSQIALNIFTRQIDNIFFAKLLTYAIKEAKCQYAKGFLQNVFIDN